MTVEFWTTSTKVPRGDALDISAQITFRAQPLKPRAGESSRPDRLCGCTLRLAASRNRPGNRPSPSTQLCFDFSSQHTPYTMSPPNGSPAPLAQWHAVTPLTRPLSISILELAPTSVTLALTRSPPTPPSLNPAQHLAQSHAHHHAHSGSASSSHNGGGSSSKNKKKKKRNAASNLQHSTSNAADSEDGADDDGDESGSQSVTTGPSPLASLLGEGQTFKDMLSHGVVVTLDGMPWSRIVAHVSDDEADGEGTTGQGDEQDEDGEWEDDWEPAGGTDAAADEGQANTTSSARPAARRRKRKGPQGSNDSGRVHVPRPIRTKDTQDRPQRWDRERAVVVVYDLDPSQEHEIELQIVGLAGEIKDNGESIRFDSG